MLTREEFQGNVKRALASALRVDNIAFTYGGWSQTAWGRGAKALISLVSSDFEGKDDYSRGRMVWQAITAELSEAEQEGIEYVFTKAPSEISDAAVTP